MADKTKISWCDATYNPWWGCVKVSEGCANCYAETLAKRTGHAIWGPAATTQRRTFGDKHWQEPLKWNADAVKAGERRRVFCASMADVFEDHPQLHTERALLWVLIDQTPALDWLLLTKRPENVNDMPPVVSLIEHAGDKDTRDIIWAHLKRIADAARAYDKACRDQGKTPNWRLALCPMAEEGDCK